MIQDEHPRSGSWFFLPILDPGSRGQKGTLIPDPQYWNPGKNIHKNLQIDLISSLSKWLLPKKVPGYQGTYILCYIRYLHKVYFLCQIQLFVTEKSDLDPDLHGSALVDSLDPDPDSHWRKQMDPDTDPKQSKTTHCIRLLKLTY